MAEKIMTLHPEGKAGVNISKAKYDQVRGAIEGALRAKNELTFQELLDAVGEGLEGKFQGSIPWYATTVKLDLEARKVIERVPHSRPQLLRMVEL